MGDFRKMKNYSSEINKYIEPKFLTERTYKLGEELTFLPKEENEANFCKLESIISECEEFTITLVIENEWTGERYKKMYQVKEGSELEMNMLMPNLACFLPPERLSVLVEVTAITTESFSLKPIGLSVAYPL